LPPPPPPKAAGASSKKGAAGAHGAPLSKGQRKKLAKQRKQRANGGHAAALDLATMMESMDV
jgi:hypothetical protein